MKNQEIIDNLRKLKKDIKQFVNKNAPTDGICLLLIRFDYPQPFRKWVFKNLPQKMKTGVSIGYCWDYGVKAPRIRWVDEKIKELEQLKG